MRDAPGEGEMRLRLRLPASEAERFATDPLLAGAPAAEEHRLEIYHDTGDLALWRHGLCLSTYGSEGRWVQRLRRADGGGEALHEVEGRAVDRTKLPVQGEAGSRLAKLLGGQALRPAFEVDAKLRRWRLALADGAEIAVTLERGRVRAGERSEPVHRLMLSLDCGSPEALYGLALALAERWPLELDDADAAARGYALLTGAQPGPHKARPLPLAEGASAEEAFVAIVGNCLEHLEANLAATRAGDMEGVHQLRVALRRLRSCLRVFRPLVPREAGAGLVEEMRWLNGYLGPARDWDVFIAEGLTPILARFPDRRGLRQLRERAEAIRRAHYASLQACLDDPRSLRLVLRLRQWLAARVWQGHVSAKQRKGLAQPAPGFAAPALKRAHRRVLRRGDAFAELSAEDRHALRIRIKRLRYTLEFFASLYPARRVGPYRSSVAGLQDCLGALHDAMVTERLLDEAGLGRAAPARYLIEGWYACRRDVQEQQFAQAWKAFRACKRPWKGR